MLRNLYAVTLASSLMLFSIGCGRQESESAQPVATRTDAGSFTAPAAQEAERENMALVRAVNAIPDQNVVVMAGEQNTFADLYFRSVTPYQKVSRDVERITMSPAGQEGLTLAQESESLAAGKHYTVIALPAARGERAYAEGQEAGAPRGVEGAEGREARLLVLEDRIVRPSENKAKLRVINAVPDLGSVRVYLRGDSGQEEQELLTSEFGSAVDYKEVDPKTVTLVIRPDRGWTGQARHEGEQGRREGFKGEMPREEQGRQQERAAQQGPMEHQPTPEGQQPRAGEHAMGEMPMHGDELVVQNLQLQEGRLYTLIVTRAEGGDRLAAIRIEDYIPGGRTGQGEGPRSE